MNTFLDVKNAIINVSKVREISIARKDAVRITFDDESTGVYSTCGDAERALEQFGKSVVQVIPCTTHMYNIYKNNDGGYDHERVRFLALCVDGGVRSYASADLFMELAEEASNFVGCFCEERLIDFPESKENWG